MRRLALLLVFAVGCAAAKEDVRLTSDFATCDAKGKDIARTAASCELAISGLVDLMSSDACHGFPWSKVDNGIVIGGKTYVCKKETPK